MTLHLENFTRLAQTTIHDMLFNSASLNFVGKEVMPTFWLIGNSDLS